MRLPSSLVVVLGSMTVLAVACGGPSADVDADAGGDADTDAVDADADSGAEIGCTGWPDPNDWSWNGSWAPADGEFPLAGLLDDEYCDGHADRSGNPTPILPPGAWDWNDEDDDLANWRNFSTNLGTFDRLLDGSDRHFGWRLVPNEPAACDYSGPAMYFEGSPGVDRLDLGPDGALHSFAEGNLGDGPDELYFGSSWSLDFRTGSSLSGALHDDDLVAAGGDPNGDASWDVMTSTIHTGPGADWVFVRDISRAAIDLGNGEGGRTDATDAADGNDFVLLEGNTHDFRVFGGAGADVAVWEPDQNVQTTTWLGPNFFGGGGFGDALWADDGTDRLVLAVSSLAPIVTATPTPAGSVLVRGTSGEYVADDPTAADLFARYCVECGTSPAGRKTIILEYVSPDDAVHTGYFYVTAFEELQIGGGEGARVYAIDDVNGTVTLLPDAEPFRTPPREPMLCP